MSNTATTRDSLFLKTTHSKLKKNVERNFADFIDDIREDLKKGFSTDVVDPQFLDQLNDIVHDEELDTFSPLKFYWMNLVDNIIYLIQLHEEILSSEEYGTSTESLSGPEEELFSLWNDSELAKMFLDILNEGLSVIEVSDQLVPLLENQIISFYALHINKYQQEFDDAIIYQAVGELGDFEKRIYLGEEFKYIDLDKAPDGFPSLALKSYKPSSNELSLEVQEDDIAFKIKTSTSLIKLGEKSLFVAFACDTGLKSSKEFISNIENALKRIKTAAPHLFDVFESFTHTIVPVNEDGIVSYSMQSLPGYSSINMFERDQIDLIDDLLHENGHHYLNTYLNHEDLINEDNESIYYSPWRKALRSIRGIYHASFTFFWALELFYWLNQAKENKKLKFTHDESIKIKARFVQEYYMLDYCWADLEHAYKNKKINKSGFDLISSIYKKVSNYKKEAMSVELELKDLAINQYKIVQELKEHLAKTRKHYKL